MAMRELRQRMDMIFQGLNLFPHHTGQERDVGIHSGDSAASETLARIGLGEKFDVWLDQLSGGQQQRLVIAMASAMELAGAHGRRN